MRNIKMIVEYDGTEFHGFQMQVGVRTVQGELHRVIEKITNAPVILHAAGRTDAGVHAVGQVVNFHTSTQLNCERLFRGINALLPSDVVVSDLKDAPFDFHSRFSAISRTYVYSMCRAEIRSPFKRHRFLMIPPHLAVDEMIRSAESLIGERDFSCFRSAGDTSEHSIREMIRAGGWVDGEDVHLYFEANAFLQHMVRSIIGTLLWVGSGRLNYYEFQNIVSSRDRSRAGPTALPHGLCLMSVKYPEELDIGTCE